MPLTTDTDGLQTLDRDTLAVPESRMSDAAQVQDFVRQAIDDDELRSKRRALVNGLIAGNPPYKASALRDANRAGACNVNWGIARAYKESGVGAFYDLFSESPGYITVITAYGTPEQRKQWSNDISEEADVTMRNEVTWDFNIQLSQDQTVLHGPGPLLFEDAYSILPIGVLAGDLLVPEHTKAETSYWDGCAVLRTYYPPQLYDFIRNEKAAAAVGWDVEYTKRVIANAMDITEGRNRSRDWEFFQQELKNNSLGYCKKTKVCRLAHVFWKEFDGRITHAIVEEETTVTNELGQKSQAKESTDIKFLFKKVGRYANWQQCIHPMYFDRGDGGEHHGVTGLGVKMFSAMEYQNRSICNSCDKSFAPQIMFKPTTTEQAQKFQMAVMGDYAVLPAGFDVEQMRIAGFMNDGLMMQERIDQILQSNLSSYRQQVPVRERGNPATKYEKQLEASQQSALNKTQFNRYYAQLDLLYTEIYRRMSNLNSTDPRAQDFQKRCFEKGVPKEALAKTRLIQATRVVGQGSAFMRKQAIDAIFGIVGALPEDGRTNLIDDKIASEAGQSAVSRYNPKKAQVLPGEQESEATQWLSCFKLGIPFVPTSTQNPVIYAMVFMNAAAQAFASLEQGANPVEILAFIDTMAPAILGNLKRFANDPTRTVVYNALEKQAEELGKQADKLRQAVQQVQEQQNAQAQAQQQTMTKAQLDAAKVSSDVQLKQLKTQAQLQQSAQKHQLKIAQQLQDLKLKDATTAAQIMLDKAKADAAMEAEPVAAE